MENLSPPTELAKEARPLVIKLTTSRELDRGIGLQMYKEKTSIFNIPSVK